MSSSKCPALTLDSPATPKLKKFSNAIKRIRSDLSLVNSPVEFRPDDATINTALRVHTSLLAAARVDGDRRKRAIEQKHAELNLAFSRLLCSFQDAVADQVDNLAKIGGRVASMETAIDQLVSDGPTLDQLYLNIASHQKLLERFTSLVETSQHSVDCRVGSMETYLIQLGPRLAQLDSRIRQLAHILDTISSSTVSSDRVKLPAKFVSSDTGNTSSSASLTQVIDVISDMISCHHDNFDHQKNRIVAQETSIRCISESIHTQLGEQETSIRKIKEQLEADSSIDANALTKHLSQLDEAIERISSSLKCKLEHEDIEAVIEARYAEIISFFESALKSGTATPPDNEQPEQDVSQALLSN